MSDQSKYDEIWVKAADGRAMCALINGQLGWLMYLREPGDAGFSSRNPDYAGPADATLEYYLSNGQRDVYPLAWALPLDEVRRALDYFKREQKPPPFIRWHNDSGDGRKIDSEAKARWRQRDHRPLFKRCRRQFGTQIARTGRQFASTNETSQDCYKVHCIHFPAAYSTIAVIRSVADDGS